MTTTTPGPKRRRFDDDDFQTSAPTTVRRRVKQIRERRGLSVPQLVERCDALGLHRLTRETITNIELGRKKAIDVDELLGLAVALDVSPLHLLLDHDEPTLTIAGRATPHPVLWLAGVLPPVERLEPVWHETHPDRLFAYSYAAQRLVRMQEAEQFVRELTLPEVTLPEPYWPEGMTKSTTKRAAARTTKKGAGGGKRSTAK